MYDNYCIQRLFESVMISVQNNISNFILIRHYNALNLNNDNYKDYISEYINASVRYYEFSPYGMNDAYEPFTDWINKVYEEEFMGDYTIDEFLDECDIYPLQREIFYCVLSGARYNRNEDVLISEIEYEQRRFEESLANIISFIAKKRSILFILDKYHFAGYSTIKFINELIKNNSVKNTGFVLIYNDTYALEKHISQLWKDLFAMAEEKNLLFEMDTYDNRSKSEKQKVFIPESDMCDMYIDKLQNMYYSFAMEQAIYYLEILNQRIEKENWGISTYQRNYIQALYAMMCICTGNTNTAILLVGNALNNNIKDYKFEFAFNQIMCLAQTEALQIPLAQKYADICYQIAKENADTFYMFKADCIRCISMNYGWKDVFLLDFSLKCSEDLINKMEDYGYFNTLAYVCCHCFENEPEFIDGIVNGKCESVYFKKGIEIGRKNDNMSFVLRAIMKKIILFSNAGYNEYAIDLYTERIELSKREKSPIREGNMYNGMGFNCIIAEQYIQANNNFNKALKIMYEENLTEKVAETLYNMATNCYVAGDYSNAYKNLRIILKILKKLGLQSVHMCNASKLYGMTALACYFSDREYESIIYVNKMKLYLQHLFEAEEEPDYSKWHEDLCIYYLLEAIIHYDEGYTEEAYSYIVKAKEHLDQVKGNYFLWYAQICIEYGKICIRLGKRNEADDIFNEAINYSNQKGYNHKMRIIVAGMSGKTKKLTANHYTIENYSDKELIALATRESVRKNLLEKENDIGILSKWRDKINDNKNSDEFIRGAMSSITNTFNLDGGLFIKIEDNKNKILYEDSTLSFCNGDIAPIVSFFQQNPKSFVVNRTDKNYSNYEEILCLFGVSNIASLVGIPIDNDGKVHSIFLGYVNVHRNFTANRILFTEDNLSVIRFIFEQFVSTYSKYIQRKKLQDMNNELRELLYVDNLTGLYNRQSWKHILESRLVSDEEYSDGSIICMDIDNFKVYNDKYGHGIGDYILICFSDVLKKIVKKRGYILRYGGDEFVIILPGIDEEIANRICEEIRFACENELIEVVNKLNNKDIIVGKDKILKCSMGTSVYKKNENQEITNALKKADEMLLCAKKNCKNSIVIQDEKMNTNIYS